MIIEYFDNHPLATVTPWLTHNSSFINGIQFNKNSNTLYVRISVRVYTYQVSLDTADEFSRSTHWGKYYDANIKHKGGKGAAQDRISAANDLAVRMSARSITAIKAQLKAHEKMVSKGKDTMERSRQDSQDKSNSVTKQVLGIAWGGVELALAFTPLPVSTTAKVAIVGSQFLVGSLLSANKITPPLSIEAAIDLGVGYSIYSGIKNASFLTRAVTPFASASYTKGVVEASINPSQVTNAIISAAKRGSEAIVKEEEDRATSLLEEVYRMPGMYKPELANKSIAEILETYAETRTAGTFESVLDSISESRSMIGAAVGFAYFAYSLYSDIKKAYFEDESENLGPKRKLNYDRTRIPWFGINISRAGLTASLNISQLTGTPSTQSAGANVSSGSGTVSSAMGSESGNGGSSSSSGGGDGGSSSSSGGGDGGSSSSSGGGDGGSSSGGSSSGGGGSSSGGSSGGGGSSSGGSSGGGGSGGGSGGGGGGA